MRENPVQSTLTLIVARRATLTFLCRSITPRSFSGTLASTKDKRERYKRGSAVSFETSFTTSSVDFHLQLKPPHLSNFKSSPMTDMITKTVVITLGLLGASSGLVSGAPLSDDATDNLSKREWRDFWIGEQYHKGLTYVVAVPKWKTSPCDVAKGDWANAGQLGHTNNCLVFSPKDGWRYRICGDTVYDMDEIWRGECKWDDQLNVECDGSKFDAYRWCSMAN